MEILRGLDAFICSNQYGFSAFGITTILIVLLKFIQIVFDGIRAYILPKIREKDLKGYGKWAVVTGSTDGIGKSYARQLAKRNMNLVLISRSRHKLISTAEEIQKDFKVTVRIIQADFTDGWELHQRIKEELPDEEIGILVNNVGLLESQPCYFLHLTQDEILNIINVNVSSLILMTTLLLPIMVKKKSGIIVNVCSLMAEYITPLMSCYGASKSLVNALSYALYWENRHTGVYVQTLVTSCVTTKLINFSNIWKYLRPFVTDPDTYSESAVRMLGQTSHTTGYWGHSVQYLFSLLPKVFQKYLFYWINLRSARRKLAR